MGNQTEIKSSLLTKPEVAALLRISRSKINRRLRDDERFPSPIRFSARDHKWRRDYVSRYAEGR